MFYLLFLCTLTTTSNTWGLISKTLHRLHPKSVRTHKRFLCKHTFFQIYKTMRTPEPVQKPLYPVRGKVCVLGVCDIYHLR